MRNLAGHSRRFCFGFVLTIFTFVAFAPALFAAGKLEVRYFSIGQGDAALVTCPDGQHHMLIDSGDKTYPGSSKTFRTNLLAAFAGQPRNLTVAVASHPHTDHLGSMLWVLTNFTVKTYVDSGRRHNTDIYGNLDKVRGKLVNSGKLRYVNAKKQHLAKVSFCPDVKVQILEPRAVEPKLESDPNDCSVAVRMDYGDRSFLFTGDLEGRAEVVMMTKFPDSVRDLLDVDVLKVGHHGSDTSSGSDLIQKVSPEMAIISCGAPETSTNKGYKHPRLITVRHFADWFDNHPPKLPHLEAPAQDIDANDGDNWIQTPRPSRLWITDVDGTVIVTTDGHNLQVKSEQP